MWIRFSVRYFFDLAGAPSDQPVFIKASRSDLADSALHAPPAGFADEEFYPDPYDKAAALLCRLAWNHPLPDGNKGQHGLRSLCSLI